MRKVFLPRTVAYQMIEWKRNNSHIIDDDRRRNAEMIEDAFYGKQDLDPQLRKGESGENIMTVPEGVDAELLAKVLANLEMAAMLTSLAKTMK